VAREFNPDRKDTHLGPPEAEARYVMHNKDAFDLWWEWAEKPVESPLTIPVEIHEAVMALLPEERRDREKVNEAVRDGIALGPLRPAGTADQYVVPRATE
jgi:hypothetical protein